MKLDTVRRDLDELAEHAVPLDARAQARIGLAVGDQHVEVVHAR